MRPGAAAVLGCIVGLAADSMNPAGFGAGALALTGVSFGASWLKAVFFADNAVLNGLFFFVGRLLFVLIQLVAERRLGGAELVMEALLWAPLSAALTAAAGVLLVLLMRPLLEASPT
jgi:rod shape-determining protein MreD